MMFYSLAPLTLLFLSLFSILALGQHTTSPRFTPNPTASGVVCIQVICPSPDSAAQPTCPSNCSSGCKMVPDQCCPQLTVAVCQDNGSSGGVGPSPTSPSATSPSASSTGTTPPPTSSAAISSSQSSPSPNANTGVTLHPSLYGLLGLATFMLYLFSY